MLANLIMTLANRSPKFRHTIFKWTFETLAKLTPHMNAWTFMNYGYADVGGEKTAPQVHARDQAERYCIQLYRHAVDTIDLRGKDVTEISCGRGGGAAYVNRYLDAKSVTGVDLSAQQIAFCRRTHTAPGLHFVQGAAENIPLPDGCADVVINIEASCLYEDTAKFFGEVRRLLRPRGHFVYADVHRREDVDAMLRELGQSGLEILKCRDITKNVTHALTLDHDRRMAALKQHAPRILRGLLQAFAGTRGTRIPTGLANGSLVYLSFVLAKPAPAVSRQRQAGATDRRVPAMA